MLNKNNKNLYLRLSQTQIQFHPTIKAHALHLCVHTQAGDCSGDDLLCTLFIMHSPSPPNQNNLNISFINCLETSNIL